VQVPVKEAIMVEIDASAVAEGLKDEFLDTARWRREKAADNADDERNLLAADLLEQLADTVNQVESNLLVAYAELGEDCRDFETHSELMRTIGFQWAPESASEVVAKFVSKVTSGG
jgi:hypothetical protein